MHLDYIGTRGSPRLHPPVGRVDYNPSPGSPGWVGPAFLPEVRCGIPSRARSWLGRAPSAPRLHARPGLIYTLGLRKYMLGVNIFSGRFDYISWRDPPYTGSLGRMGTALMGGPMGSIPFCLPGPCTFLEPLPFLALPLVTNNLLTNVCNCACASITFGQGPTRLDYNPAAGLWVSASLFICFFGLLLGQWVCAVGGYPCIGSCFSLERVDCPYQDPVVYPQGFSPLSVGSGVLGLCFFCVLHDCFVFCFCPLPSWDWLCIRYYRNYCASLLSCCLGLSCLLLSPPSVPIWYSSFSKWSLCTKKKKGPFGSLLSVIF